ncbi:MAG: CopG family transcriptional regulator [Thaumarchaeota archaeon]|nr:MAG: CopG family transcriptional regulator [Nitrososphaerota archaeon]
MGVITLKIDDELEKRLRVRVGQIYGAKRGSISASVEEAIRTWLLKVSTVKQEPRLFVAIKQNKRVAEAPNLAALSKKLAQLNVDPRDVIIETRPLPPLVVRMGLRTRSAGE